MEPKFDIPSYDQAMVEFITSVLWGLTALDPLLGEIPIHSTGHSGPNRNVPGPQPVDHPLVAHEQDFEIHFTTIRNTDVDAFTAILFESAQECKHQILSTMFQTLNDITDAVGNTLYLKGEPLGFDHINDMLEKMDITFDENGRPIWPTIVAHPDMAKTLAALQPTREQLQRQDEIAMRKKAEYNAKKRTRRLPR
jgi:hypothetical protein